MFRNLVLALILIAPPVCADVYLANPQPARKVGFSWTCPDGYTELSKPPAEGVTCVEFKSLSTDDSVRQLVSSTSGIPALVEQNKQMQERIVILEKNIKTLADQLEALSNRIDASDRQ